MGDDTAYVNEPWRDVTSFSEVEKQKLRPIAERLALLEGNAFFTWDGREGHDWYESYLPEADVLWRNGSR